MIREYNKKTKEKVYKITCKKGDDFYDFFENVKKKNRGVSDAKILREAVLEAHCEYMDYKERRKMRLVQKIIMLNNDRDIILDERKKLGAELLKICRDADYVFDKTGVCFSDEEAVKILESDDGK